MDIQEQSLGEASGERDSLAAHSFSVRQRLLVMVLSYLPLLHVSGILWVAAWPWAAVVWRTVAALGLLYLLPPLVARIIVEGFPFRASVIKMGTVDFFKWWTLLNLQVVFCRLPALDEVMRLIPSVYSAWLRLWGSKIGRLVYWSAETRILDRSFLDIGDDVVFGAGVRLNPHVIRRNDQGEMELILASVRIGPRAVIGGYSLLTAGTEIPADEATRACLLSPPFTQWRSSKRVKE